MMNGYTADQVRAAEAPLLAAGEPLMARAAHGLAEELRAVLAERAAELDGTVPDAWRILLLVGSGDNGGDALFAAAELAGSEGPEGVPLDLVVARTGDHAHEAGYAAAVEAGVRFLMNSPAEPDDTADEAKGAALVVDAVFGIGASRNPTLRGAPKAIVEAVLPIVQSAGGPTVVAVDVPSGIDPDEGSVPEGAVLPAEVTVTFGAVKAGLLIPPGSAYAGDVRLIDIGLGPQLADVTPFTTLDQADA
ncbi:NAD(P)H-hydrate epimerase [Plantibacter sp. VKM Ac-2880]|uniref:NAD(P)H-hydrate epimerase n=1 Tax=Plantibacter sp. VKM Ac-2880 TaxID=2783827 RepID=UPI00188F4248|nr:NAD(P)H-hydrate epimerase [Plantibacter sp. VKM Ac-2880]MBF4568756.1 NAD(P)H-hydrate epimerase [Plantibacter sp. VKM Ac-2880]